MTYDSRKTLRGQEYVEEIEIQIDACRYTVGDIWATRNLNTTTFVATGYTGNITLFEPPVGWSALWSGVSPIYIRAFTGEICLISIVSDTVISVDARGQFGTTDADFTGAITVEHKGRADGSCVGFPHSCSSADSYSAGVTRNLIWSTGQNAGGVRRFAGLFHGSIKRSAGEVDVGETIGTRASLSFTLQDQKHNDYGIVPYTDRQTTKGTMFGKLLARHPYFVGRPCIYRAGLRDTGTFAAADYIERVYIIDSATLSNSQMSIKALDPLILTEEKKAQIPVASAAVLSADIVGTPATFNYIDAADYYFGPMAASVFVRIDSEVIECTVSGAKQLTVVTRGYRSESKDHSAGASIQDCEAFINAHGIDIMTYALENYTATPAAYIDDYASVKALLPSFIFDEAILSKPMAVIELLNLIIKLGNLIVYFDEQTQKIVINYIPELQAEPIIINESEHIKRDSVMIDQNIKNQFTRHSHLWAPVDITKDSEENYLIRYLQANLPLEGAGQMGEINEKKELKNPLLTKSSGDSLIATSYVDRVLSNTETPPKIATVTIDAGFIGETQGGNLSLGSIINLYTSESQDINGDPVSELYQVLKIEGDTANGFRTKMRRYQAIQPDAIDFSITENKLNYDLSTEFAPVAGHYTVYIAPGVEIGSSSTGTPAFSTGTQSAGVSFTIVNRGSLLGMGGDGGNASIAFVGAAGNAGGDGGNAFNATVPCVIDNGSGLIWAGGGGGSGNGGDFFIRYGGCGGQGYSTSDGGINTEALVNPPDPVIWIPNGDSSEDGGRSGAGIGAFSGGEWGENGENAILSGGLAGFAIVSNGNSVTFSSGDNTLNIKGRRS